MDASYLEPLRQDGPVDPDAQLVVEIVFSTPLVAGAVGDRVAQVLPETPLEVAPALDVEGPDRFHFVRFPEFRAKGAEPECFAFARQLKTDLEADEVLPMFMESIYGASVVTDDLQAMSGLCSTGSNNTLPHGWVHPMIDSVTAWAETQGTGTKVAVIDTGWSDHDELDDVLTAGGHLNLVEGGTDARDRFSGGNPGHGTLVMSVVASRGVADGGGNTSGPGEVTGAAPETQVLPIRAITSVVNFRQTTLPRAILHAVDQGADVIAMALGGIFAVGSVREALGRARDRGVVVVCAAGNCWPFVIYPAAFAKYDLCCAVAAVNSDRTPWARTGRGPRVTVAAPGVDVWGARKDTASAPNDGIRASQGTTLATSLTSGVAALWVAKHGGRSQLRDVAQQAGTTVQAMFRQAITSGLQKPPEWNGADDMGAGIVDAGKALAWALPAAAGAPVGAAEGTQALTMVDVLRDHLEDHAPEAMADLDDEVAPYAAELLWMSYRNGARLRAAAVMGPAGADIAMERVGSELDAVLAERDTLRNFVSAG